MDTPLRIAVSAGEISGDQRAKSVIAHIAQELGTGSSTPDPSIVQFKGMGGSALRSVGVETIVDSEKSGGVMGFTELFSQARSIISSQQKMKSLLKEWKPHLLIIVDYPDFNLRLARHAHHLGIPVLDYIPPKVWAWRKGRIRVMNQILDSIATIFPFEVPFYQSNGCNKATYVGHPFSVEIPEELPVQRSVTEGAPARIAVFPGSRKKEIERHLPVILASLEMLQRSGTQIIAEFVAPNERIALAVREGLRGANYEYELSIGNAMQVMRRADIGLLKSGTCNLEAAYLGLPFVCIYQGSPLSARIAKYLLKIKEVSLVNIHLSGTIKELLQWDFTPNNVSTELKRLTTDIAYRNEMKQRFATIRQMLKAPQGGDSPSVCVAKLALSSIKLHQPKP